MSRKRCNKKLVKKESNKCRLRLNLIYVCICMHLNPSITPQVPSLSSTQGGKFFFFEHIKEWDAEKNSSRALAQTLLTKTRIWPAVYDGCELDRDTLAPIQRAGFSKVEFLRSIAPGFEAAAFGLLAAHLTGVATKWEENLVASHQRSKTRS